MKTMNRRDFLKSTAVLTAATALMPMSGLAEGEKKPLHVKAAFFSPTEGTKNAVAMLAAKFSKDIEYVDLTNFNSRGEEVVFAADDLAIVGAPSYGGQIPMIEGLFTNLKGNDTPCVVVCAFGNRAVENVYANLAHIVSARGFKVIGAIGLVTPHVFSSNAKAGHSRPNVEDNQIMAEFAEKIMEKLAAGQVEAVFIVGQVTRADQANAVKVYLNRNIHIRIQKVRSVQDFLPDALPLTSDDHGTPFLDACGSSVKKPRMVFPNSSAKRL